MNSEDEMIQIVIKALLDYIAGECAGNAVDVMCITFAVLTAVPYP